MSDTKTGDDKTLSVTPKKTLTLKRPGMEQGTVRQNFSHGRTKSVVVETKKRKFVKPGEKPEAAPPWRCSSRSRLAASAPGRAECRKRRSRHRAAAERGRHGAERTVDRRDGSAPQRARRLEGSRGRGSPARRRRRQAPRRGRRAPPPRARGIRAPPGRGRGAAAGRGRIPPPRRGRGAPPRAARRAGDGRRRRRGQAEAQPARAAADAASSSRKWPSRSSRRARRTAAAAS